MNFKCVKLPLLVLLLYYTCFQLAFTSPLEGWAAEHLD